MPEVRRFDAQTAFAVLAEAVRRAGLEHGGPRLIRLGSNAVFAVGEDVVARVAPPGADASAVRRALTISRWLEEAGFPSARAVPPAGLRSPQPITVRQHLVTFWVSLGDHQAGSTRELGELLRRFHALVVPPELGAPSMDPVARARHQLVPARISPAHCAFLLDRLAHLDDRYRALDFPLGTGLIHGDATAANVVRDRTGRAHLIDFDLVRSGPREWDLVRTATYHRRLGWTTTREYADFCLGYGLDVTTWPGFDVMADLVEMLHIAWLADAATRRPELTSELRHRIRTVREGGSRYEWHRV